MLPKCCLVLLGSVLVPSLVLAEQQITPPVKKLPMPGVVFSVSNHTAFLMEAKKNQGQPKPWVLYAPTLPNLPGPEEQWMFERFLQAGISIAGIDVGESYGNTSGRKLYSALYDEMTTKRGFAKKTVLLGRSRGGLMALSWAANNPEKVAGFAGIYPVCSIASYPGLAEAAKAYGLNAQELEKRLAEFDPVDRLAAMAKAKVPLFAIHGDIDYVVPLNANSDMVKTRYQAMGGTMDLLVPKGQGHSMWEGFFQSQELVDFVLKNAKISYK
jgi:pimeloyl-ACP methyl ester carboxylesterase